MIADSEGNKLTTLHIELWCDSFHEGDWAARSLSQFWKIKRESYEAGFIPQYTFEVSDDLELVCTIFGSYSSWSPLPDAVHELLKWGKPDLVVYDTITKRVLFAAEETAATPTGNQALQRCERLYGAQRYDIPFVYLLGEFGTHKDGGIRRDSIWPTLQALALTAERGLISTVVHFGDRDAPDSYNEGAGFESLSRTLWLILRRWLGEDVTHELEKEVAGQYERMLAFIKSQWRGQVSFLPGSAIYDDVDSKYSKAFGRRAAHEALDPQIGSVTTWPATNLLPKPVAAKQVPLSFLVEDPLLRAISELIMNRKAYVVSKGAGSRALTEEKLRIAIESQRRLFFSDPSMHEDDFLLNLRKFPRTKNGARHVVTAKRILYLLDSLGDFKQAVEQAYGLRRGDVFDENDLGDRVFLFVCNSITPGRLFGDPYTGSLAAYVPIFAKHSIDAQPRRAIAYYPHQSHTQLLKRQAGIGKGIQVIRELLDYAVFHSGVSIKIDDLA